MGRVVNVELPLHACSDVPTCMLCALLRVSLSQNGEHSLKIALLLGFYIQNYDVNLVPEQLRWRGHAILTDCWFGVSLIIGAYEALCV